MDYLITFVVLLVSGLITHVLLDFFKNKKIDGNVFLGSIPTLVTASFLLGGYLKKAENDRDTVKMEIDLKTKMSEQSTQISILQQEMKRYEGCCAGIPTQMPFSSCVCYQKIVSDTEIQLDSIKVKINKSTKQSQAILRVDSVVCEQRMSDFRKKIKENKCPK